MPQPPGSHSEARTVPEGCCLEVAQLGSGLLHFASEPVVRKDTEAHVSGILQGGCQAASSDAQSELYD